MQDPNLFSMPIWKGHKKSSAIQTRKTRQQNQILNPGKVISVDQMVSPVPGLIAQPNGIRLSPENMFSRRNHRGEESL